VCDSSLNILQLLFLCVENLKDLVTHLSRRSGEVAGITLSAASMFDSTSGITIFCKQEVERDLVDRHGEVVTM